MKRLMDIILSGLSLLVFSPLLIPVVIILRCTGEGEIFYRQERIGRGGEAFQLLKFATMLKDSPNIGTGTHTTKGDPRVLPYGQFLRKTKLNELPQLLNIFLGDMSIIGPRPTVRAHFDLYPPDARRRIETVRPGLSGIGSIIFRDEETILSTSPLGFKRCYNEVIAPYKAQVEEWYVERQGILLDITLILMTIWVVLIPGSDIYRRLFKSLPPAPQELENYI
jgi:lipopolysaccharide/colanic/teichoic acid biosynthesis glycosyltransferase